jgi:hypothetical protein
VNGTDAPVSLFRKELPKIVRPFAAREQGDEPAPSPLRVRFPFPLGKGLGVRLSVFPEELGERLSRGLRRQSRVMRRQPAETVALDLQGAIESRSHILERDSRSQIDDLLGVEMALEFLEYLVGNVNRGQRHLLGVAERRALGRREQRILGVLRECREFLIADSKLAATGSIDVDSKNAADHLRGAQTDHPLQGFRGDLGTLDRLHKDRHRERDAGTIRPRLDGIQHFADPPLQHPGQRPQHPAHLIFFESFNTHLNNSS